MCHLSCSSTILVNLASTSSKSYGSSCVYPLIFVVCLKSFSHKLIPPLTVPHVLSWPPISMAAGLRRPEALQISFAEQWPMGISVIKLVSIASSANESFEFIVELLVTWRCKRCTIGMWTWIWIAETCTVEQRQTLRSDTYYCWHLHCRCTGLSCRFNCFPCDRRMNSKGQMKTKAAISTVMSFAVAFAMLVSIRPSLIFIVLTE